MPSKVSTKKYLKKELLFFQGQIISSRARGSTSLLLRQKWHHTRRNLQVNDVCLLKDSNAVRGNWRLARVNNVFPDSKGVVRNVEVAVSSNLDGTKYKPSACHLMKRHVFNLIFLVPADD